MPLGDDAALLVGVDQRRHRRDVERRLDAVALEQLQDARHRDPGAVLAPGHPPDRLAAVAQFVGFMIAVERQRDRAARAARPFARPQRSARRAPGRPACASAPPAIATVRDRIPVGSSAFSRPARRCCGAFGTRREVGRSGEIRTHDPQHPMLMRYQAALRSDRVFLARADRIAGGGARRNAIRPARVAMREIGDLTVFSIAAATRRAWHGPAAARGGSPRVRPASRDRATSGLRCGSDGAGACSRSAVSVSGSDAMSAPGSDVGSRRREPPRTGRRCRILVRPRQYRGGPFSSSCCTPRIVYPS